MKKALAVVCLLVVALVVLSGCSAGPGKNSSAVTEKRVTSAKIRYFDGSLDTVVLQSYVLDMYGMVILYTEDGRKVIVGPNNVMIIEESEAQYNCME